MPMRNKYQLFLKEQIDSAFMVCYRKIIKDVVDVYDLSDHAICLLGNRVFSCVLTDKLYEFCKRSSGMNLAASNFKIALLFCKFVIDQVSVCDYSSGESLQEFPGMFRMRGKLPVKENDRMCATQRLVPVDPYIRSFYRF